MIGKKLSGLRSLFLPLLFFCVTAVFAQDEDKNIQLLTNSDTYIGIGLHGYPAEDLEYAGDFIRYSDGYGVYAEKSKKDNNFFFNEYFSIPKYAQKNVFAYQMSHSRHANNVTYINELGNFNNGSKRLTYSNSNYINPQCFIALAKCDWLYHKVLPGTGIFPSDPDSDSNSEMEKFILILLRSDIRFVDFYISKEHLENRLNAASLKSIKNRYEKEDKEYAVLPTAPEEPDISPYHPDYQDLMEKYQEDLDNYNDQLENYNNKVKNQTLSLKSALTGQQISQIAEALYDAVRKYDVPNTIKLFTHSMGGMFTLRYLTASEDEKLYKYYRDYTQEKFLEDIRSPNGSYYPYVGRILTSIKNEISEGSREPLTGDDLYEDLDLTLTDNDRLLLKYAYRAFREERENQVDTALLQDGPLAGSETANFANENYNPLLHMFNSPDSFRVWQAEMVSACVLNIAFASFEIVTGSVMMTWPPPFSDIGEQMFYHGLVCLTMDLTLIPILSTLIFEDASKDIILKTDPLSAYLSNELSKVIEIPSLNDAISSHAKAGLTEDMLKGMNPARVELMKDLPHNSDFIKSYKYAPPPQYKTSNGNEENIQIHNLTVSGVDSIKRRGIEIKKLPLLLIAGTLQGRMMMSLSQNLLSNSDWVYTNQNKNFFDKMLTGGMAFDTFGSATIRLIKMVTDLNYIINDLKGENSTATDKALALELLMPTIFDTLGIIHEPGSGIFCHSESTGINKYREINAIAGNENAFVYQISTTSKLQKSIQQKIENNDPDRSDLFDSFIPEYLMVHQWSQNSLFRPITAIINKGKYGENNGDGYIYFNNSVFKSREPNEKDKDNETFSNISQMTRTLSLLKTSKFDGNSPIPEWDNAVTKDLKNMEDRDFYHMFTYGYYNGRTPNNVYIIKNTTTDDDGNQIDAYGNKITYYTTSDKRFDRGFNTILYDYDSTKDRAEDEPYDVVLEVLDGVQITGVVLVLPINIYNYFEDIEVEWSINGGTFNKITKLETVSDLDIHEYGMKMLQNEQSNTSYVFDDNGQGLLISPKFKEGFNEVVFKFTDPSRRSYYKGIQVTQLTVPPFVKPVYPKMNQFIGSGEFTLKVACEHIADGFEIPEEWFRDADYSIVIDGQEIFAHNIHIDESTRTISVDLMGLNDGSHEIEFKVNYNDLENSQFWRFWVDSTAPEIQFKDEYIFSNKNQLNVNNLSYFISDTVHYENPETLEEYDVDTVLLKDLNVEITQYGATVEVLKQSESSRMGVFSDKWSGWSDDIPLNDGVYSLSVYAKDSVGNESHAAHDVIIDNHAPFIDHMDLNTTLVNLDEGLFEIDYRLFMDDWEDYAVIQVDVENLLNNQEFTLSEYVNDEEDHTFTLSHYENGLNVFTDGEYNITVTVKDPLDNISEEITFYNIIVDRTSLNINNAILNPFVLDESDNQIDLELSIDDSNDIEFNKSSNINMRIELIDAYGNVISDFSTLTFNISVNSDFAQTLDLPSLNPGKYFVQIVATDKNNNVTKEMVSFIKSAMPPDIISPEQDQVVEGLVTIYGNIYDPQWNNDLDLDHYELYYKYGSHSVPVNLENLSSWSTNGLEVPEYQKDQGWPENHGRFTIEGNNLLGSLDTTPLDDRLVTLLVVAVEAGGYRIASTKTFRIANSGDAQNVNVEIDSLYKDNQQFINYTNTDDIAIEYSVTHSIENTVDIYSYIKNINGKLIKRTALYNQSSNDMVGKPDDFDETGLYIYNQGSITYLCFQNRESSESKFTLKMDSSKSLLGYVDSEGNDIEKPGTVVNEDKIYLKTLSLEPDANFIIGFKLDKNTILDIFTATGTGVGNIYIGQNKSYYDTGSITIYPGSEYPPVIWDGKDELGRYVENGEYTIGVEAFGKNGGKGSDSCTLDIITPFIVSELDIYNNEIQPGVDTLDFCTIKFHLNKPGYGNLKIYNEQNDLVKEHNTDSIPEAGYLSYKWYGDDNSSQSVSEGKYSIVISAFSQDDNTEILLDEFTYPELGNIVVNQTFSRNTDIQVEFNDFNAPEQFNGNDILQGNKDYKLDISANGQYLPDRVVDLTVEPEGTKVVEAYPDLNYMAAFRTIYKELWAELNIERVKFRVHYDNHAWWPFAKSGNNYYSPEVNVKDTKMMFSYDVESNKMTKNPKLQTEIIFTTNEFRIDQWKDGLAVGYDGFKSASIPAGYYSISKGKEYTDFDVTSVSIVSKDFKGKTGNGRYRHYTVTVKVIGTYSPKNLDDEKGFLAKCDGIAIMGPDVNTQTDYSHTTDYVNMISPVSRFELISENPIVSTQLQEDNQTEIWRQNPEYYFYYIGEDYENNTDNLNSKNYIDNSLLKDFDASDPDDGELFDPALVKEVKYLKLPDSVDFQDVNFEDVVTDGRVQFTINRVIEWNTDPIPYIINNKFYVSVNTDAEDRINYPFPAPVSKSGFYVPHKIGKSFLGIPQTIINGNRLDNKTFPCFYVPVKSLHDDTVDNVYFPEDIDNSQQVSSILSFDKSAGYHAEFNLSGLNSDIDPDMEYVNIKQWGILDLVSDNVSFRDIPSSIPNDMNEFTIEDDNIDNISDTLWDLNLDNIIADDSLLSDLFRVELNDLNRYGNLRENRFSNIYPFNTDANMNSTNMYYTNSEGKNTDNLQVVIDPDIRDYSGNLNTNGYNIDILGLDNNQYSGLEIKDIAAFGKGLKLSDGVVLKTTDKAFKSLVTVYASGEGDIRLSYKDNKDYWTDIPIYNGNTDDNILTYWDVTGLNGLVTLRLVSFVGDEYNIAYKDVYIGYLVNTSAEKAVLSAPSGQAQIIFPVGSVPEDTVMNIDTVNMEDIKDIAVLPDISTVGKVITLSPDGHVFEDAFPQLQFTYNKNEIDELGVDPRELVIYHLREDGELVSLNTIKQLIKVNYNDNNEFVNEEVVWDTREPASNIVPDYTYVKAWAITTHFSYYCVIEGLIENMPKITGESRYTTSKEHIDIKGTGLSNEKLFLYVGNNKYYMKESQELTPVSELVVGNDGNFTFNDISLPIEGENYIFIGYENSEQFTKLIITRDTTSPELTFEDFDNYMSPDGNGIKDYLSLSYNANENSMLDINVIDQQTSEIVYNEKISTIADCDSTWRFDGYGSNDVLLSDGLYTLTLKVSDYYNNSTNTEYEFVLDTAAPQVQMSLSSRGISPKNQDGLYDTVNIELESDGPTIMRAWLGNEFEPRQISIYQQDVYENAAFETVWDGKDSYGNYVNDSEYFISIYAEDKAGNVTEIVFDNSIKVDNSPAEIRLKVQNNQFFVIPDLIEIPFSTSEETQMTSLITSSDGEVVYSYSSTYSEGLHKISWDTGENILDGIYSLKLTTMDIAGNEGEILINIELINDVYPPEINLISELTFEANAVMSIVDIPEPVAIDDSLPITISSNAPAEYPIGETIITWSVSDRYNNKATAFQKIIIVDTTKPQFTFVPEDITREASEVLTPVDIGLATADDIFEVTMTNNAPEKFPLGETVITWTATDANGNQSYANQTVVIQDTTPPELTIPEDITRTATQLLTPIDIGTASATDIFDVTITNDDPGFYQGGTTWVTWTATDANGNVTVKKQKIFISKCSIITNKDTFLKADQKEINEGANHTLMIRGSGKDRFLIGFNLDNLRLEGLKRAYIKLTFYGPTKHLGPKGSRFSIYRVITDWVEGNGWIEDRWKWDNKLKEKGENSKNGKPMFGYGSGATWSSPEDTDISNHQRDGTQRWNGGQFIYQESDSVILTNEMSGSVIWDVTEDLAFGADFGWLLKRIVSGHNPEFYFYSREGATYENCMENAPTLILEYE